MKNKFEAVQESAGNVTSSGWTVKFKANRRWFTVCDTWCSGLGNAKETAEMITDLLNKANESTERVTVKIKDCDGDHDGDLYFKAPAGMNEKKAVQLVNRVIRKVQKNPDYIFDDLEMALCELGFDQTSFVVADARW